MFFERSTENEANMAIMAAIVNTSPHFISYIERDGTIIFVNRGAEIITGYSRDELIGKNVSILHDEETNRKIQQIYWPKLFEKGTNTFEIPLIRKDGEERIVAITSSVMGNDSSGAISIDVTDRVKLERDLLVARDLAEQGSEAKSTFLSHMSHEIRTPLNAIVGMTSIAQRTNDMEKKDYCLTKIEEASKHLLNIVNDILDMSKIEANKFELFIEEFDLEKMIMAVVDVVSYNIQEKNQTMLTDIDSTLPVMIESDELHLKQVITNLLSNAIKFTDDGGTIRITAKKIDENEDECHILFKVIDNGIGMTQEQQRRLFSSFEQADNRIARKYGGTGLGLAISKHIIEQMGGQVWLKSKEGKGSEFSFAIKVKKSKLQHKRNILRASDFNKHKILIAESNSDISGYFKETLNGLGISCDTAFSAQQAFELMKKDGQNPYSIFFLDWEIDGGCAAEFISRIRKATNSDDLIIVVLDNKGNETESESIDSGADYFLRKPIFASDIVEVLHRCVDSEGGRRHIIETVKNREEERIEVSFEGRNILVAEDIPINREIVQTFLSETQVNITFAQSGEEALSIFNGHPDKYDLIFMDLQMGEMDGYETARRIRENDHPKAKSIPIIAMTANVFRKDVEMCLASGMNDHVGKPIKQDQLLKKLLIYLNPNEKKYERVTCMTTETRPYLNIGDGLRRLMNNEKLFRSLLQKFSCRKMVDELIEQIRAEDYNQITHKAHAIKGAAANMAMEALKDISEEIERMGKRKESCVFMIDKLNAITEATQADVDKFLNDLSGNKY